MLTDRRIQATIRTATTETVLNDGDGSRGAGALTLRIRIGAGGASAAWVAQWDRDGKRSKKTLGKYPDLSLAEAREKFADEIRPLLQEGKTPNEVAKATSGATVEALCRAYVAHLRASGKRRADEYERILLTGKYALAEALGRARRANSIDAGEVAQVLKATDTRGSRRQADIERTTLVAVFNYAIKSTHNYRVEERRDWGVKINPAALIPRDTGAVQARERNLTAAEIRAMWNAAPDQTGDVLRLVIACGQRVLETIRVAGADIDLDAALWTMPAHKTKGGKNQHILPIPPQAVAIFRQLKEFHGDGPLFPARAGAKGEHVGIPSVSRGASRLTVCDPFQPRDLRRTWKSRAGDAGVDRFTRDLIQQHAQNDTGSKFYDRMDYLPQMREAMAKWATWLDAALCQEALQLDAAA